MMNRGIYDPFVQKFFILPLCIFRFRCPLKAWIILFSGIISINQKLLHLPQQKNIFKFTFSLCKNNIFRRKTRGQVQKQFASFFFWKIIALHFD